MRRLKLGLAIVAIIAGGAYTAYWFHIARGLADTVPAWAAAQAAQGYTIQWQTLSVDGFPFRFRVRLGGATLHAERPVPYDARSDEVVASASPFGLGTWRVSAPRGIAADAPTRLVGLDAVTLDGTVALGGEASVIAVTLHEVAGQGLARGFTAALVEAKVTLPRQAPAGHRDTALAVVATVRQATLPFIPAAAGRQLDTLSLTASVRGALPPGALQTALAQWRDAGGTVEIEALHAVWGETTADIDGTLALDRALQPEGAMTAAIVGADKAVDAVVAAGALPPRYAGVAKSVLQAISAKDEGGGEALRVPLTLQEQRLYIGPAAVAVLPHIDWR